MGQSQPWIIIIKSNATHAVINHYGPFATRKEAQAWADENWATAEQTYCVVVQLASPEC